VLGGGIGLAATAAISGSVPSTLLITTAAATGVGLLAGTGAALIPGLIPTRLPLASLLSAD
jgi:hypothetical protein